MKATFNALHVSKDVGLSSFVIVCQVVALKPGACHVDRGGHQHSRAVCAGSAFGFPADWQAPGGLSKHLNRVETNSKFKLFSNLQPTEFSGTMALPKFSCSWQQHSITDSNCCSLCKLTQICCRVHRCICYYSLKKKVTEGRRERDEEREREREREILRAFDVHEVLNRVPVFKEPFHFLH